MSAYHCVYHAVTELWRSTAPCHSVASKNWYNMRCTQYFTVRPKGSYFIACHYGNTLKKKNQITVLGLSRLSMVGFFVVLFWESGVKNHTSHEELCICKCRLNVSLFISWSPSTSTLSWKSGSLHGELFFGLVGFQNISRSSVACSWPYGGQSPIPCWKKKIHLNLLCTSLCFLFCCDSLAGKR